jgi:hypothetical protein
MTVTNADSNRADMPRAVDIEAGVKKYVRTSNGFPQYAYGLLQAAFLGAALDQSAVSALELGVAGGNGLVELERLSLEIGAEAGLRIDAAGFDLGSGMPEPIDHRDLPWVWSAGFFSMDEPLLRSQLRSAQLIIGDIAQTGPEFLASRPAPIGFISFDLDYYSSTVAAFGALLDASADRFLPRVMCYFDDTVGPHEELHCEFTGELLAIAEFNAAHRDRKLTKVNGLARKLPDESEPWVEGIYVLHLFDHPRYNEYVFPERDRQFPLTAHLAGRPEDTA